jgi:DNA-binding transcriptional ArsR family regulator
MVMHPYQALAEPVRWRIVDILASGEHTSGEIAAVVGFEFRISRTAVSQHLRVLRDAGLVDVRAEHRWRWYYLVSAGIEALEANLDDLKMKRSSAVGWDAEHNEKFDPLANLPHPRRRGRGRPHHRGERGRQTEPPPSVDPSDGLYPAR